jgi:hypothetical protein
MISANKAEDVKGKGKAIEQRKAPERVEDEDEEMEDDDEDEEGDEGEEEDEVLSPFHLS